jgi:hypothetical protein
LIEANFHREKDTVAHLYHGVGEGQDRPDDDVARHKGEDDPSSGDRRACAEDYRRLFERDASLLKASVRGSNHRRKPSNRIGRQQEGKGIDSIIEDRAREGSDVAEREDDARYREGEEGEDLTHKAHLAADAGDDVGRLKTNDHSDETSEEAQPHAGKEAMGGHRMGEYAPKMLEGPLGGKDGEEPGLGGGDDDYGDLRDAR